MADELVPSAAHRGELEEPLVDPVRAVPVVHARLRRGHRVRGVEVAPAVVLALEPLAELGRRLRRTDPEERVDVLARAGRTRARAVRDFGRGTWIRMTPQILLRDRLHPLPLRRVRAKHLAGHLQRPVDDLAILRLEVDHDPRPALLLVVRGRRSIPARRRDEPTHRVALRPFHPLRLGVPDGDDDDGDRLLEAHLARSHRRAEHRPRPEVARQLHPLLRRPRRERELLARVVAEVRVPEPHRPVARTEAVQALAHRDRDRPAPARDLHEELVDEQRSLVAQKVPAILRQHRQERPRLLAECGERLGRERRLATGRECFIHTERMYSTTVRQQCGSLAVPDGPGEPGRHGSSNEASPGSSRRPRTRPARAESDLRCIPRPTVGTSVRTRGGATWRLAEPLARAIRTSWSSFGRSPSRDTRRTR